MFWIANLILESKFKVKYTYIVKSGCMDFNENSPYIFGEKIFIFDTFVGAVKMTNKLLESRHDL